MLPLLTELIETQEVFWLNPNYQKIKLSNKDVQEAEDRLKRFAPYIASAFPETKPANGMIESPLVEIII